MDVFEAAYRVAHDHRPDGAVGLARKLGKNPGTFLNKLNPGQDTSHLTLEEAVLVSTATGDRRILQAFAATLGCGVFELPPSGFAPDSELISLILRRERKQGEFARALDAALADGRISADEARELSRWGAAVIQKWVELVKRLEAMADDDA